MVQSKVGVQATQQGGQVQPAVSRSVAGGSEEACVRVCRVAIQESGEPQNPYAYVAVLYTLPGSSASVAGGNVRRVSTVNVSSGTGV